MSAEQALLFVEEVRKHLTPVALNDHEYLTTIQTVATRGLTGGKIYDALLLACAIKSEAQIIYTWNLKHFHSIAPQFAERIQNP